MHLPSGEATKVPRIQLPCGHERARTSVRASGKNVEDVRKLVADEHQGEMVQCAQDRSEQRKSAEPEMATCVQQTKNVAVMERWKLRHQPSHYRAAPCQEDHTKNEHADGGHPSREGGGGRIVLGGHDRMRRRSPSRKREAFVQLRTPYRCERSSSCSRKSGGAIL